MRRAACPGHSSRARRRAREQPRPPRSPRDRRGPPASRRGHRTARRLEDASARWPPSFAVASTAATRTCPASHPAIVRPRERLLVTPQPYRATGRRSSARHGSESWRHGASSRRLRERLRGWQAHGTRRRGWVRKSDASLRATPESRADPRGARDHPWPRYRSFRRGRHTPRVRGRARRDNRSTR